MAVHNDVTRLVEGFGCVPIKGCLECAMSRLLHFVRMFDDGEMGGGGGENRKKKNVTLFMDDPL